MVFVYGIIFRIQGYNATILAYGQTGTGKTYTMEGASYHIQDQNRGIVPRSVAEIFKYIEGQSNLSTAFEVRAAYLQIYNEMVSDLINAEGKSLQIREHQKKGVFVEGLSEWIVKSPEEVYSLIQRGAAVRATASTKMNEFSSRSHAVFMLVVEQVLYEGDQKEEETKRVRVSKLNLVDLAGSERVRVTGATGKRLEECKKINQSLSALGNVIAVLTESTKPRLHVPYRNSKVIFGFVKNFT